MCVHASICIGRIQEVQSSTNLGPALCLTANRLHTGGVRLPERGTHHIALEQAIPEGTRDCKHAANAPGAGPDNDTPAASMRLRSSVRLGLWSSDSCTAARAEGPLLIFRITLEDLVLAKSLSLLGGGVYLGFHAGAHSAQCFLLVILFSPACSTQVM